MRKVIFAINTTLDGFCDHTLFYPDEETMEYFTYLTRNADTFVYGRKTYELMVPYWPDVAKNTPGENDRKADIEFARAFNAVGKIIVFSKSLDNPEGGKTRIIRTGLHEEILKLKQDSQLAAHALIDEYHLVVHPIIAGEGRRLFEGIKLQEKLHLKLVESTVFKSGVLRFVTWNNERTVF